MALEGSLDVTVSGDDATFEFTVENAGDDPVTLSFRSAKTHDFAVLADDAELWRLSDGQMYAQMLQTKSLDPGAGETFVEEWSAPESGDYVVVATLEADPGVEVRESFSV